MKNSPELKPTKYDLLVVCAIVLLAGLLGVRLWGGTASGALTVAVTIDGAEAERVPLADYAGEHTYTSRGYTLTVTAADGGVAVTESDCPSQDCVHSGAISRAGQSIVCLPARITVTLDGAAADYDVIAG